MKRFLAVFSAMVMLFSLSACGGTENTPASNSSTNTSSADSSQLASQSLDTDESGSQESYAIGETATLGDWEITVTACDFKDKISDSSGYGQFAPDDGNKFIVISASITNNGKQSETFLPSFATNTDISAIINYNGGYEYQMTNLLGLDSMLVDSSMNPLTSKSGIIVFEAPDAVVSGSESLILQFSAGEEIVSFALR